MSLSEEQRLEAYRNATLIQRRLYGSVEDALALEAIAQKHTLTEEKLPIFVDIVGDVILGFNSQTQLPDLLQSGLSINHGQAVKITADLIDFLEPLTHPEATDSNDANLLSDIAETQAALDAIQPIRTMGDDVAVAQGEEMPVHHSSQEHIFGQRPVLGETPRYGQTAPIASAPKPDAPIADSDEARWHGGQ